MRDLSLQVQYSTDSDDLVADFYSPCLQRSVVYRRAVGFFTSHGLSLAAQGIAHLLRNGGRIELIASPKLSGEDIEAIHQGYRDRPTVLREAAASALANIESRITLDRLNALAWLVSSGKLEVKLAFRTGPDGRIASGIFHEKLGLFIDAAGDVIAFSGSSNETVGGLVTNYESVDVFWSWDDPHGRVKRKVDHFGALWSGRSGGLEILNFTETSRELLEAFKAEPPPENDPLEGKAIWGGSGGPTPRPRIPPTIVLREYQETLRDKWLENNGRGVLKMATGTGKTITALAILERLANTIDLTAAIIVCPLRHLVTQWDSECRRFGLEPILAFEGRERWQSRLSTALYATTSPPAPFVCVIVTNATLAGDAFQAQLRHFPKRTLLIGDEVHNLGASRLRTVLPTTIGLRLGLSATPERWFDEEGTSELFAYFGDPLSPEITLADGLRLGALCPYRYDPRVVELTDAEHDEYLLLSERIAKAAYTSDDEEENDALRALLMQRARLVAVAHNKLETLRATMSDRLDATHMLFYCGDGRVGQGPSDEERRHVDAVCQLLGRDLGFRVSTYTAEDSTDERERLRARFESGDLQGLVAIRCLDEGIDIPAVRSAVILASSTNPRQFIQRRGRILRNAPGKTRAEIIDMIVAPPESASTSDIERRLLRKELTRFREFAGLATNAGQARASILGLQRRYDLMDV